MTQASSRMQWPYPTREDDPWYDYFKDFVQAVDASGFATREDGSIIWTGGGTVSWDLATKTLTWTDVIEVYSPIGSRLLQIAAGSIAGWENGEVVYLTLTRQPLANIVATLVKASQLPSNDNARSFAVRIGNAIFFRTGMSLGDGDSSASGIAPIPASGGGLDPNAIHVNVAGEITGIALKGTPTGSDVLVIEDAADANNKKRITVGSLPPDPNAIHTNVAGEIAGIALKATPTSSDLLVIEDVADANNKKRVTIGSIAVDKHTAKYIVGNALAGDTLINCHFLDPGDGSGIAAALAAAVLTQGDVWIRPGTYDLGSGGSPVGRLTIPPGVMVRGAGKDHVTIVTATTVGLDNHAFSLDNYSSLMDVGIYCPTPVDYMSPSTYYIVDCIGYGALVQRVKIEFEGYWSTLADPYYVDYTYGAFGCSGFLVTPPNDANKFVDDEVFNAPYSTVNNMALLEHDTFGGGLCQVERFYGEGGLLGIIFRESGHIVNSVVENEVYSFWDGISTLFANNCVILGNRVLGLFDGGGGSKAYRLLASNGLIVSNNFGLAYSAVAGADFLDISQCDDGSFMGNVGVGFINGISLNAFSDDNEVIGNNVGGAAISDLGTGNDLAHNK